TTKESEELDIDLNDTDLTKAATKIQASFRGHKVRKEMKHQDEDNKEPISNENQSMGEEVDLNDPELLKAATKIQATFRGYQSRKQDKDERKY
ncbi:neuromodulin-like, partial [Limulus polyphemus]|uniref:Neuromodulin-like n=1 Tax=Limulus polyphemus TaxID=6850 RepID=A0ABM1C0D5_LIMPO